MSDIDKLRGVPRGHTATDKTVEKLRRVAVAAGATMIMGAPGAAQNMPQGQDKANPKVEVLASSDVQRNDGTTFDATPILNQKSSKETRADLERRISEITLSWQYDILSIIGKDGTSFQFEQSELNGHKFERSEELENRQAYSKKTEYEKVNVNTVEDLAEGGSLGGFYPASNKMEIVYTDMSLQEFSRQGKELIDDGKIDGMAFVDALDRFNTLSDKKEQISTIAHETSHRADHYSGAMMQSTLTYEQAALLDMFSEIKATMAEVKLGYDNYRQSGNIDDIQGFHAGDLSEFKNWLKENPNSPDVEQRLGVAVYEGWLECNNFPETGYMKQAKDNAYYEEIGELGWKQAGAKFENHTNRQEYHKKWDMLFANTALGDLREVLKDKRDVAFGKGVQQRDVVQEQQNASAAGRFLNLLASGAKSVRQVSKRVKKLYRTVKKIDKDGVRTEKEQAKLNKTVAKIQQKRGVTASAQFKLRTESKEQTQTNSNTNSNTNSVVQMALQKSNTLSN